MTQRTPKHCRHQWFTGKKFNITSCTLWLQVWKFILDREVEAPERFQAIQTYRATTAVLKQQMAFVESMYDSGIVDDMERDELLR